jgi:hypothetical protein
MQLRLEIEHYGCAVVFPLGAKLARFTSWMPAKRLMWPRSLPAARLGVLALRILPVAVKIELVDEHA